MSGQARDKAEDRANDAALPKADENPPSCALIVGCRGRMGGMLQRQATEAGMEVAGIDLPFAEKEIRNICEKADMAIFCVPAKHFESTIKKFAPHLRPGTIVADITSVKEIPMRQMENNWNGPVVGTHPLFGPKFQADSDLPVALVRGKGAEDRHMAKVRAFFTRIGCRVFETSASQHDKAMAKIQNLNFITNVAYFAALAGQEELLPFLTPSFFRRQKAAQKMLTEDGDMFCGLFEANPHSQEAARQFKRFLNLAASGDIQLLCRRAQWWFPEDNT